MTETRCRVWPTVILMVTKVSINDFLLVSVSQDLPRLQFSHPIFEVSEPLSDEFIISVEEAAAALAKIKVNKAIGPDNIPPLVLKDFSHLPAAPVAAIFNSSLRKGVLPKLWKSTTVIPLPKKHPPCSVQNDIILAEVFESLVFKWVDNIQL